MKKYLFAAVFFSCCAMIATAQRTEIKRYSSTDVRAGDVFLLNSYGERQSTSSTAKVYITDVPSTEYYYISALANLRLRQKIEILVDGTYYKTILTEREGWQYIYVNEEAALKLARGKHSISFVAPGTPVPMVEELYVTVHSMAKATQPPAVKSFLDHAEALKQQPILTAAENQATVVASKVLANPEGEYSHAIDTAFAYSHFSYVYLNPGTYTFTTSGSTVQRSLAVFNPLDYSQSSANVNGGPGGESSVTMSVTTAAYYAVTLRPVTSGGSGTTNILMNGSTLVSNAIVAGKYYWMPQVKGGPMNFFTCKLTTGDTRIFASRFASSSIRGYNDDYSGPGNWDWHLASRIKKDFSGYDSVQYAYVCAFSPTNTGICDIYFGNGNSNLPVNEPENFPALTEDDAIRTATNHNSWYNCISWSGGITATWIWPPSSLSTYSCNSSNYLLCFDNYYSNNPVRYPGAWNYTRSGATVNNAVVDLWKTASAYTHASVQEPGNNHPHGYDWESKPGSLDRTFHPRNALVNASWYGSVTSYYRPTGTYARTITDMSFKTDADAVKAGVAIFDKGILTAEASEKLSGLLRKNSFSTEQKFNELYAAWDATKAANASLSDPAAYCKNKEYKAMESFALANQYTVMLLSFDKFIKGDHFIGDLMVTLTKEKYGKLLDEVKTDRLANPYDKEGRYRIHGDHDNGVLYIEKILKSLQEEAVPVTITDNVSVSVSPNPVADRLTVQVKTEKAANVSVMIVSTQSGMKQVLRPESMLVAGTHRFETSVKDITTNGTMLAVQVTVDGVMKTVKVMVMK